MKESIPEVVGLKMIPPGCQLDKDQKLFTSQNRKDSPALARASAEKSQPWTSSMNAKHKLVKETMTMC